MIKEKISNQITAYADERFNEYRGQVTGDVVRGVSAFAGVIVAGSMALLSIIFVGTAIGFGLSAWLGSYFYGFGIVGLIILFANLLLIFNRKKWVEQPIFRLINEALHGD